MNTIPAIILLLRNVNIYLFENKLFFYYWFHSRTKIDFSLSRNHNKRSYMYDIHHGHHQPHHSRDGSSGYNNYSRNNYHHQQQHHNNQVPFNQLQHHHQGQYMSHQSYPVIQNSMPYQSNNYSSSSSSSSHKKHRNRSSCNYF